MAKIRNPILRFLDETGIGQSDLARAVKRSRGYIGDLVTARCSCGRKTAVRIVEFSAGKIDLHELVMFVPTAADREQSGKLRERWAQRERRARLAAKRDALKRPRLASPPKENVGAPA